MTGEDIVVMTAWQTLFLSDDEAVEAALNSTDGVREVIYKKEPLEITLEKFIWQGKFGTTTTVDYFLEV